jgi:adenylyl cyclase-associated protein
MPSELAPLQAALDSILNRLACLETKVGLEPSAPTATVSSASFPSPIVEGKHASIIPTVYIRYALSGNMESISHLFSYFIITDELHPALAAFDAHMSNVLSPFVSACKSIQGLDETGASIETIWKTMRNIIEIGTRCKKPVSVQESLMPHLKPIQDSMLSIRQARLDRSLDWHIKAIMEMLASASWVIMSAPPAPSNFINDTIGASDFWANKIRKEHKGKDDNHIAFCDTMKKLIQGLADYVKEYHLSGLMWNPRGVQIEDYKGQSSDTKAENENRSATALEKKTSIPSGGDVMKELALKRSSDGSSAATGLRKVTKDMQTWRKEYKADSAPPVPSSTVKPSQVKAAQIQSKQLLKEPVKKFIPVGCKWIVENQTKESNPNGVCVVEVQNPKEQVYIYNCDNATIQIKGKLKSVVFDSCTKSNLLFETAISSCEIVNCKSIQVQSTGLCPSFSIDKTDGCLIYLSDDCVKASNFVTSKSSEMNVSWFDVAADEQKEAPIPEQFVHKLVNGSVTSEVSDLYH